MNNRGFGVIEIMVVLILLIILTIVLKDELTAFVSFLVSGII